MTLGNFARDISNKDLFSARITSPNFFILCSLLSELPSMKGPLIIISIGVQRFHCYMLFTLRITGQSLFQKKTNSKKRNNQARKESI